MICICESYASSYGVLFNPNKSVCVNFTRLRHSQVPAITPASTTLSWVPYVKHLGNWISFNLDEDKEITQKKGNLIGRNTLIANLGDAGNNILSRLFSAKCVHFYSAQMWQFANSHTKQFHTTWKRCVNRILHLPHLTHIRFLPYLVDTPNSFNQVASHFISLHG